MTQWYQNNRRLFREEREALAASCPLMVLSVVGPGFRINPVLAAKIECAIAHGTYILKSPDNQADIEYGIALGLPENYPKFFPMLFCNDPKLPIDNLDRHIQKGGRACLEVGPEIKRRWPPGSNLIDFLKNLVEPFLAWQVHYDIFGKPPEWGERAHGKDGILQYYAELLGIAVDSNTLGFMKLISRKNRPKGHEICPCGSGKKLRHCHGGLIYEKHKLVDPRSVAQDVFTIEGR